MLVLGWHLFLAFDGRVLLQAARGTEPNGIQVPFHGLIGTATVHARLGSRSRTHKSNDMGAHALKV